MTDSSYTISIENAHHTIDKLHHLLSSRQVKTKKSDLKEAVSALLGFETSNVFDAKIRNLKDKKQAQCVFDRQGRHKENSGFVLKNVKNPLRLYDYFKKHRTFTTFIKFCEDWEITGGYNFKCDDVLFATDKYSALKAVLNWDVITQFEFKYWKDEEFEDLRDREGGYWELAFVGEGDEQHLSCRGDRYMCSSREDGAPINSPDVPIEDVSKFFIDELLQGDMHFFVDNREGFEFYLNDLIGEYYGEVFSAKTEDEFVGHIEKFLPYLSIETIVSYEVGSSPVAYLEILKKYGACFNSPELLFQSISSGDLEVCHYFLAQGNVLENIFKCRWSDHTYFHSEASCMTYGETDENAKLFYETAYKLGVDIDRVDKDGCSPLHHAAKNGKDDLYEFLVSLGAKAGLKNNKGNTPEVIKDSVRAEKNEKKKRGGLFGGVFEDAFSGM